MYPRWLFGISEPSTVCFSNTHPTMSSLKHIGNPPWNTDVNIHSFPVPIIIMVVVYLPNLSTNPAPVDGMHIYTPQNKHGTWKWTLGKGDSYWKPSFPGSMLNFGGVHILHRLFKDKLYEQKFRMFALLPRWKLTNSPWKWDDWKMIHFLFKKWSLFNGDFHWVHVKGGALTGQGQGGWFANFKG